MLIGAIIRHAKDELRVKSLIARVYNENHKAINLYLRHGFYEFKSDDEMSYFRLKLNV